jgi:uncharacterized protein YegL
MSRRLPIYLLLDTSGSMMGEPLAAVEVGLKAMQSALRKDPHALEQAYVSVIIFGGDSASQLFPLTEVAKFQPPSLAANGGTPMGRGLSEVVKCANKEIVKRTSEQQGDWKPLVFILTDGMPTDDDGSKPTAFDRGLDEFKGIKWGNVIACAAGPSADDTALKRITENVVRMDTIDTNTIAAYFKWLSASIATASKSVNAGNEVGGISALPPPPPEIHVVT